MQKMDFPLLCWPSFKEGLSEVERLHAKFGDVSMKYIKRVVPNIKVPRKFRCECCLGGKIHKFGHKACLPGRRTEYTPGVCIHTDHSGPYAKSISQSRYSQLWMDRGSSYLWAARQVKKTDHYTCTPRVLLDARALSGRPVQIMQTDGDGVFSGGDMLALCWPKK